MRRSGLLRWLGIGLCGVFLYALFLVVFAPAAYLANAVNATSGGTLTVRQPSGTLWHGSGTLVVAGPASATATPFAGQLEWTLHPWRLVTGSLGATLRFTGDDAQARARVDFGLRRHMAHDVHVVASVTALAPLSPFVDLLGLSGKLQLSATTLTVDKENLFGDAELLWGGAAGRLLPVKPVGDYRLALNARGKQVDVTVATTDGALHINAQGNWQAIGDGVLRLQGTATSSQPALEPFLNALGPPQADGQRTFSQEIRLAPFQPETLFPL